MGRVALFPKIPSKPFNETKRRMSGDEVVYHLKRHRGEVMLSFMFGPSHNPFPADAILARDHVCNIVKQYSDKVEFYVYLANISLVKVSAVVIYTKLQTDGTTEPQEPLTVDEILDTAANIQPFEVASPKDFKFKGKPFKRLSEAQFDALSDDDQEEYIEVERQYDMLFNSKTVTDPDDPEYEGDY